MTIDLKASKVRIRLFISYSRSDLAFARSLIEELEKKDLEVAIDFRDLPFAEEFKPELLDMIRRCDTVIWLLSPDSVQSRWCQWELSEVNRLNKRLVPVKIRDVDMDRLPEPLASIHTLPAMGVYDSKEHLRTLVETLETDRGWIKEYTRLTELAAEWNNLERKSGLLRGSQLQNAEAWLGRQPAKAPRPNMDVVELIQSSRKAASERLRYWTIGAFVGAGLFAIIAVYAIVQQQLAVKRERDLRATFNARTSQTLVSNPKKYTDWRAEGLQYITAPDFGEPLDLVLQAVHPYVEDGVEPPVIIKQALRKAVEQIPPWAGILKHQAQVESLAVERSGNRVASLDFNGNLTIWDLANLEGSQIPRAVIDEDAGYVSDERRITWCGPDHLLDFDGLLINIETGDQHELKAPHDTWSAARCNPDGTRIAIAKRETGCVIHSIGAMDETPQEVLCPAQTPDSVAYVSWNTSGNVVIFSNAEEFTVADDTNVGRFTRGSGRFLGWSQRNDQFSVRSGNKVRDYVFDSGSNLIDVTQEYFDYALWPDALKLLDNEVDLLPGLNNEDMSGKYSGPIHLVKLSPDLRYLFVLRGECHMGNAGGGCESISIDVRDTADWLEPIRNPYAESYGTNANGTDSVVRKLFGHIAPPTSLAWHPSGKTLVTGASRYTSSFIAHDADTSAIVWSVDDARFYPQQWGVNTILPTGTLFCSFCSDNRRVLGEQFINTTMWSEQPNAVVVSWTPEISGAGAYTFTEDSTYLFDLSSGQWINEATSIAKEVFVNKGIDDPQGDRRLEWPNRGKYWHAPYDEDDHRFTNRVEIVDPKLKEPVIMNHPGFVPQAKWSPNGDRLLTSCSDGFARIFDASDGKLLDQVTAPLQSDGNRVPIDFVDWSPDGKWVIMSSRGYNKARIAAIDTKTLRDHVLKLFIAAPPQGTTKQDL